MGEIRSYMGRRPIGDTGGGGSGERPEPADANGAGESMRVALVHDYFTQLGGAERVVGELVRLLEPTLVAASVVDRRLLPDPLVGRPVASTWLQPLLRAGVPLAAMAPFLPAAFEGLALDGVDVVVSSSSAFAHHVRPRRGTRHLAYVHTPPRFIWQTDEYFRTEPLQGRVLGPAIRWFRRSDRSAVARVDRVIANSAHTAQRLRRIHGIEATVIHPPIDAAAFAPSDARAGRFLVVARLRPYKRLDVAIEAAGRLGAGLDIIGSGPDLARLRRLAGPTVRFLGRRSDAEVAEAMARCEALIVPGGEDFGLTMAEVQAAGRPPVALAEGGALEIVEDGRTGFLVDRQDPDAFAAAMDRARAATLPAAALQASAARFDRPVFAEAFRRAVAETIEAVT